MKKGNDMNYSLMPHTCFVHNNINRKGNIQYLQLDSLLGAHHTTRTETEERWLDDEQLVADEKWACQRGSVGEWLLTAGCPAEKENFKVLISCLEQYERETGIRISPHGSGFVIPLGPELRASLGFTLPK